MGALIAGQGFVGEDVGWLAGDLESRVWTRSSGKLLSHLIQVVQVDMAVPAGPDELPWLEPALLCHHVREQRVAGDVEGHAKEDVAGALV